MGTFTTLLKRTNIAFLAVILVAAQMLPYIALNAQSAGATPTIGPNDWEYWCSRTGDKFDTGAVGTHTQGPVELTIALNGTSGKTEVSNVVGTGVTVTKIVVKGGSTGGSGGDGNEVYNSPFSFPLVAPNNNGGNQADVSHVKLCYERTTPPETTLQVVKKVEPSDADGKFDLFINNQKVVTDAVNNSSSTAEVINPEENAVVKEEPGTGLANLDGFATSIVCTNQNQSELYNVTRTGSSSRTLTLNASKITAGDVIVCVFTNTEDTPPPSVDKLKLTSLCTEYDEFVNNQRKWRILNPNAFAVDYRIETLSTGDEKTGSAQPGYTYVYLDASAGNANTTKVYWYDENKEEQFTTKASQNRACTNVTVTKFVNNNFNGDKLANTFPVRVNGTLLTPGTNTLKDGNSFSTFETVPVPADKIFTVTEDTVPGYTLKNVVCQVNDQNISKPFTPNKGDHVKCNVVNEDVEPAITVVASKVVCSEESLLPNYGTGGPNITSLTAIDWVTNNDGCKLAEGWNFEWATEGTKNPGDNEYTGGSDWTMFGPTDVNGQTTAKISDLENVNKLWFREMLPNGYLGFTYNEEGKKNTNDVSAEMYCHSDVLNYDNYDFIRNFVYGETYHCVAWNVELAQITATKYHDYNQNGTKESNEPRLDGWEMTVYQLGDIGREVVAQGTTGADGDGKVVFDNLLPGTYYVCETPKTGWERIEPADSDCRTVVLRPGRENVSRFGNVQYGRLKVNKIERNDNGGTAGPQQFGIEVDGEKYRFSPQGMVGVALLPGEYAVEEIVYEGYEIKRTDCEKVVIRPGQTTECTFVNDDIPPKVIVKKCIVTQNKEVDQSFDFRMRNNNEGYAAFSLYGQRCDEYQPLPRYEAEENTKVLLNTVSDSPRLFMTGPDFEAGRVNIREDVPRDWVLRDIRCYEKRDIEFNERKQDIALELNRLVVAQEGFEPPFNAELGKTYVCTYTNVQKGKVVVTKFNDLNQNGVWDEGEPTLEGWDMTLTRRPRCEDETLKKKEFVTLRTLNDESDCDEEELRTRTQTTDEDGEALFRFVRPGVYEVDEELQEGWEQTGIYCERREKVELEFSQLLFEEELNREYERPENRVRLRPGQTRYCYVGNYELPAIETTIVAECGNDFPYLRWNVDANFTPTQFVISWFTVDGNDAGDPADVLVTTQTFAPGDPEVTYDSVTDTYEGYTLFPGADPNVPSWPGYELVNGEFVANPSVNFGNLRPSARVELAVNPTDEATVEYPPSTPTCDANPSEPQVLAATTTTLADTGSDSRGMMYVGVALAVGAGTITRKTTKVSRQK